MPALATIATMYQLLPASAKKALRKKVVDNIMGTPGKNDGLIDAALKKANQEFNGLSEKEVAERMKPYKKTVLQDAIYGSAMGASDLLKGAFDYKAVKDSLLGDALLSMSHIADSPGYVNPLTAAVAPTAAAYKAKGAGRQIAGDTAYNAIRDLANPIREGAERRLSTELLIRENPNAGFYDYNRHRSNIYNKGSGRNY